MKTVERSYRKPNLPTKLCLSCGRSFAWRKKWKAVWHEVKTCSERCKGDLRRKGSAARRE